MLRRLLLKDENGLLSKESARSIIDGSVFQKLADEREKRLQRKRVCVPDGVVIMFKDSDAEPSSTLRFACGTYRSAYTCCTLA